MGFNFRMKEDDYYVHTILFTTGTAILMACFKRGFIMFFGHQWRLWLFLLLNLILLSIIFTSPRSDSVQTRKESDSLEVKIEKKRKKKKKRVECMTSFEEHEDGKSGGGGVGGGSGRDGGGNGEVLRQLSKEELNERVEAFIAMFRQHLVLDARKGIGQSEFSFCKESSANSYVNSGVKC